MAKTGLQKILEADFLGNLVKQGEARKEKTECSGIDYDELEKMWDELLANPISTIETIDANSFPPSCNDKKPYVIFFSANWCKPCKLRKPTYAMFSRFFTKAQLFYTQDEQLAKEQEVTRYPTLIAYFPNGTSVESSIPLTTLEFWDTLNKLIALGQNYSGKGRLACTENECKIESL